MRCRRYLLRPLSTYAVGSPAECAGLFDAVHTHTVTSGGLLLGSRRPADYEQTRRERNSFADLVDQTPWRPIAELELYRGCTRRKFCDFCNEPAKSPLVAFREVDDVVDEAAQLYAAGIRNVRRRVTVLRRPHSPTLPSTTAVTPHRSPASAWRGGSARCCRHVGRAPRASGRGARAGSRLAAEGPRQVGPTRFCERL